MIVISPRACGEVRGKPLAAATPTAPGRSEQGGGASERIGELDRTLDV